MKKFFSFVLIASLSIISINIYTKHDYQLTEKELAKLAKKHSAKAWKNFDKFLTNCMIFTGITCAASAAIPTDTYNLPPHCLLDKLVLIAPEGISSSLKEASIKVNYTNTKFSHDTSTFFNNMFITYSKPEQTGRHTLSIAKPPLVTLALTATTILGLTKFCVKMKRARDQNANFIKFLFTDIWA